MARYGTNLSAHQKMIAAEKMLQMKAVMHATAHAHAHKHAHARTRTHSQDAADESGTAPRACHRTRPVA